MEFNKKRTEFFQSFFYITNIMFNDYDTRRF